MDATRVSERGQVVIPKDVRERLRLKEGSRLLVFATQDSILLQPADLVAEKLRARDFVERARALVERLAFKR